MIRDSRHTQIKNAVAVDNVDRVIARLNVREYRTVKAKTMIQEGRTDFTENGSEQQQKKAAS